MGYRADENGVDEEHEELEGSKMILARMLTMKINKILRS